MKAKTVYECSDGKTFEKKTEAKQHEKCIKYGEEIGKKSQHLAKTLILQGLIGKKVTQICIEDFLSNYFRDHAAEIATMCKNYHLNKVEEIEEEE